MANSGATFGSTSPPIGPPVGGGMGGVMGGAVGGVGMGGGMGTYPYRGNSYNDDRWYDSYIHLVSLLKKFT